MKKMLVVTVAMFVAPALLGCGYWRPSHHCCGGGDWWGRGGRNFWPGFVGGVVGGMAYNALTTPRYVSPTVVSQPVVTTPVVVQQPIVVQQPQPVVVQQAQPVVVERIVEVERPVVQQAVAAQSVPQYQNVWVEGHYVSQTLSDGTVTRSWQAGHYEKRVVQ